MSRLPPSTDELFRRARSELAPTDDDRARNLAAVLGKLAPGGADAPRTGHERGAGGSTSAATGALGKVAVALAIAAGAGALVVTLSGRPGDVAPSRTAPAVATTATSPAEPLAIASMDVSELPSVPAPAASSTAAARHHVAPVEPVPPASSPPSRSDALAAELALLERIHSAERDGEADAVLALAREHERAFPHGVLAEERDASRAVATCQTWLDGRDAALRAFEARYPRSPHAARVRAACVMR